MIVQCEHCQTKYRIADEKVKGKGVKVRCAKCENVFTVAPAEPGPPSPPPEPSPPEPVREPPSPPPAPEPEGPAASFQDPLEQSADLPPLGDAPSTGEEAVFGQGLPGEEALPGPSGAPGGFEPPASPEEFGSSATAGAGRPAHERDRSRPSNEPPPEIGLPDGGFELEGTMRQGPDEGSGAGPDAGGLPDLSPPAAQLSEGEGDWGNIAIGGEPPPEAGAGGFGLAAKPQYEPPPPVPVDEDQMPPGPSLPGAGGPTPASAPSSREDAAAPKKGGRKGLVLLLLLAVLGGAGYLYYPKIMEYVKPGVQKPEGTLSPVNVQVKQLNRSDGKVIYTVRGEVRNDSSGTVGMIQVEAQFRNAADEIIGRSRSFCGNIIGDGELVSADMGKIKADLNNELGQSLANASIPSGGAVPFLVLLENPPAGVSKVTVTISSFQETT